ncbi:hypothetical protein [Pantoea sp.]|uniref:hypothetical protein n=1 Tax=Pantoea sp. TaxID=69393 RepID=UPI0031D0B52A
MVIRPAATLLVPTVDGFALVDKSIKPKVGSVIYFEAFGLFQLGRLGDRYIVCQDGETIEGEALEEVTVVGVQTWGVLSVYNADRPTI